jgi:hypothetical protein
MYVVFAVIATGELNDTVCQPDALSFVNVAVASCVPEVVHKLPVCVPVLAVPL